MQHELRLDPRSVEIVDEDVAQILRTKTGAERLAIAFGMFDSAWDMLTTMLTADHPDWSEQEIRGEVIRRLSQGDIKVRFSDVSSAFSCSGYSKDRFQVAVSSSLRSQL